LWRLVIFINSWCFYAVIHNLLAPLVITVRY